MKALKENVKALLISSAIVSSATFAYVYGKATRNRLRYQASLVDERSKDNTRMSNEFFGINWGYRADSMIKDRIDTGDVLFVKFSCENCISTTEMVKCYARHFTALEGEYDSVGFTYRNQYDLYVIYSNFDELKIERYADFLSKPYCSEISLRKLAIKNETRDDAKTIHRRLTDWINKTTTSTFDSTTLLYDVKPENKDASVSTLIRTFLSLMNIASQDSTFGHFDLNLLDNAKPVYFSNRYSLDKKLIIRSKTNDELVA
eukprot:TRINITY_DN4893_c0_g4_i1.p1 TRINITY_DN4893_c0_g4~~TRINITY_DN4893_c0_g4_i1.p1  ORF type:complete len:260 (-),score=48.57 TRINITY_DN4893_c0_g4_i1:63-842(-)